MQTEIPRAEINMARIPVGGGAAGLIFALGTTAIFVIGIPAIRWMLPASVAFGCGIAFILRLAERSAQSRSKAFFK